MKKVIDLIANNPVLITAITFVVFYFIPIKPKPFGDGDFHDEPLGQDLPRRARTRSRSESL